MPQINQVRVLAYSGEDIGMGFNSDTGLALGTALTFDTPTRDPGQEAQATATIVNSHDAMMSAINMSAQAQGHYAFSSANLKVDFSKNTTYNSVSSFVVAKMVVNNQISRGRNFRITPEARALLDGQRFDAFARAFGDSFVRGKFTGGEFYAVMRITSVDSSVQTSLAISLQAEINGGIAGGSFQGALRKANEERHSRSEFFVTFYQKGGAGEAEIGTTLSIDDVKTRLRTLPTAVANNPFPYEIEVATYDTVPIPIPTKEQQDDFLMALADADQQKLKYLQQRNDLEFAAEHPEYFDDPPPPDVLQSAAGVYLRAVNAAIAHAVRLSRGEISPPQFFDPRALAPPIVFPDVSLRKKNLGLERNFADWYIFRDDPSTLVDDRKLVNAIAEAAKQKINDFHGIVDPGGDPAKTELLRGRVLGTVVNGFTSIDLSGFSTEDERFRITSIGHLPTMLPPDMTTISVATNQLIDLRGIDRFPKLVSLNVSTNQIGEIGPIAALTSLEELSLFDNQIVDLSPLKACVSLKTLDVSGNRVFDLTPLRALTKLTALTLEGSLRVEAHEGHEVRHEGNNPIQIATGLAAIPGIANPFLLGDRLSVRLGALSEGAGAQFTGTAVRIGRSNRFAVTLARGAETRQDEWEFWATGTTGEFFPDVPPDSRFVTIFVRSLNRPCICVFPPGDPARAVMDRTVPTTAPTLDAVVAD